MSHDTVEFTEKAVKEYLDDAIHAWRFAKSQAQIKNDHAKVDMATYYIDAFQSVRISLFGELLGTNNERTSS